jgi:hypothetical protein
MGIADKSVLEKARFHITKEIGFQNICSSIKLNYEIIQKAHYSIHEFIYLEPLCLPGRTGVSWHPKSAFLTYGWEAFHQAHRSFLEALSGYYNAAYTLLRSTLELLIKGAFWECLAHESFREMATQLQFDKFKGNRKSVNDWVNDLIEQEPSVKKDLEKTSAAIFDKMAILFRDSQFRKEFVHVPTLSVMIKQLIEWQVVDIPNAYDTLYCKFYTNLSKDVHVVPDATDVGRRLHAQVDFMEIEVIPDVLTKYMKTLHTLIDIGIVIELNILRDWIELADKSRLKERSDTWQDLGLKYSTGKLKTLIR